MDNRTRVYWHTTADRNTANRVQHVKNLGWLLRNAQHVSVLSISRHSDGARLAGDGTRNGQPFTFVADFASYTVALRWLARPSLAHATIVR